MSAPLKVCFTASEYAPLAKTGGLADVIGALSRSLHMQGHDVRPFLPLYSSIDRRGLELAPLAVAQDVPLRFGAREYRFSVFKARERDSTLPIYLIDCPELYGRAAIYGSAPDEHIRFLLLTRATIETCQRMAFAPDVFHCHDWHTSMAPMYLRSTYTWDRLFARTKTVLTIHNVGYQGRFAARIASEMHLDERLLEQADLAAGSINFLKHGILYADSVTTVSPTYAREIRTPEYGMGLQDVLEQRASALTGILNGVDYQEWSPETDRYLPCRYDVNNLAPKAQIKQALMERMGLKEGGARIPLLGIVTRMARQKGIELLFGSLPPLLARGEVRLAAVGSGETQYEDFFLRLQRDFPGMVGFHRGYSEELAHAIEAGSDIFLMPSLYEPCGLNQMYSLRYGTVPVVRRTGGLADSVQHFDPATGKGTGIVFNDFDTPAMQWALKTALGFYQDKPLWERLMRNGMREDFSWDKQVGRYIDLYRSL